MKLIAYVIDGHELNIRPAPLERDWMDKTPQRFAYRCLPLNIANAHGWEVLCPTAFKAVWAGEPDTDSLKVTSLEAGNPPALSHFGSGILTFHVPCVFRTDPGFDLLVFGPLNRPKDAISALSGVIETDWAPYTFTMNWIFTQPEIEVTFEKGEPFCHLFPVRRGEIETVEPSIRPLSENAELLEQYDAWRNDRTGFNAELKRPGSQAWAQRWQKHYFRGLDPSGRPIAPRDHTTRVALRSFGTETK